MGWSAGGEVFGPVARKARELGLTDEQVTGLLVILVRELQDRDWDTEGEALREFQDDEAIVEAFRQQGVVIPCNEEITIGGIPTWCARERGQRGHADGMHEDYLHRQYPVGVPR